MTRAEYDVVAAQIAAYWPTHPIPETSDGAWFEILAPLDLATTTEAVKVMYAEGREFPPNAGQILRRVLDAAAPADFGAVIEEIRRKLKELNRDRRCSSGPLGLVWETPAKSEWSAPAIAELVERGGGIGAWFERLTIGFPGTADDTSFIAQMRGFWNSLAEHQKQSHTFAAIGATRLPEIGKSTERMALTNGATK